MHVFRHSKQNASIYRPFAALGATLALFAGQAVAGPCPYEFTLSGKTDQLWKNVTNTAWNNMLPPQWVDKGFHFYSQARSRGPANGINTPGDLELEIHKKVAEEPEGHPNRWQILLPILNSKGDNLRVVYDYDGGKTSKCELVTLSF